MPQRRHWRAETNPRRAIAFTFTCVACFAGGCAGVPLGPGTIENPEGAELRIGIVEYYAGTFNFDAPPAGYRLRSDDVGATLYLRVANDLRSPTLESLVGKRVRCAGLIGELAFGEIVFGKSAVMDVVEVGTPPTQNAEY